MTNTYYAMAHKRLTTFHLFAGAGGGILADILLGHAPVGACEIEPYPRSVLLKRQSEGLLPEFPIWDDVQTMDGRPWRGTVDVLCGGFPCQDISAANPRGKGIEGSRSGLWKEYARLVEEMQPRFVFAENSPLLRSKGLGTVLQDLASMGYNARWGVIGARHVPNGPHRRDRMWVLAYRNNGHFPTQEEIQSGRDTTVSGSATQSLADSNLLRWNQGNQTVEGGLSEWSSSSGLQSQPLAYPLSRDHKGGNAPRGMTRKDGKSRMDNLPNVVAYGGLSTRQMNLLNQSCSRKTTQLNPSWVEWLMGWPIGWTDLKPLEMDKFHNVQLWRGKPCQSDSYD